MGEREIKIAEKKEQMRQKKEQMQQKRVSINATTAQGSEQADELFIQHKQQKFLENNIRFEKELSVLHEQGFTNDKLNIRLLKQHKGNLDHAVHILEKIATKSN